MLDTHLPQKVKRKDKLEKVINKNTIKLNGTPNMASIISSHNKKILEERRGNPRKCATVKGELCHALWMGSESSVV